MPVFLSLPLPVFGYCLSLRLCIFLDVFVFLCVKVSVSLADLQFNINARIYETTVSFSICLSEYLSICLSVFLSFYWSIGVCLSHLCPSVRLPVSIILPTITL